MPIAARFGLVHLSSGDLLRRQVSLGSEAGLIARSYMDHGDLVPDEIILGMLRQPLIDATASGGYVLDGYPRTVKQAENGYRVAKPLDTHVQLVVHLDVPAAELVRRLLARARGIDDTPAVIATRIRIYQRDSVPLLAYYTRRETVIHVDGAREVHEVTETILRDLTRHYSCAR